MAHVTRLEVEVKPAQVIPAVVEKSVVLKLSEEEAQLIADIMAAVGGKPTTRRQLVNEILSSLTKAGFMYKSSLEVDFRGSLMFL